MAYQPVELCGKLVTKPCVRPSANSVAHFLRQFCTFPSAHARKGRRWNSTNQGQSDTADGPLVQGGQRHRPRLPRNGDLRALQLRLEHGLQPHGHGNVQPGGKSLHAAELLRRHRPDRVIPECGIGRVARDAHQPGRLPRRRHDPDPLLRDTPGATFNKIIELEF